MQVKIVIDKIPIKIKKRKNWFLATSPDLDVSSQGETKEKAIQNLGEAISLFLITCFEVGTLEDVLQECGYHSESRAKNSPKKVETIDISVPIPFLNYQEQKNHLEECHA
ncbi:MAG: hypothetical protein DWQ06_14115 [Calditrichaeota bacterium]|nr:MAG: hypothetical protein DWQ06_14115 [Calditrichota bacterium]